MASRLHLVLVFLLAAASLARSAETIDRIVAIVNGHPVMESEMVEALRLEQLLANNPPQAVSRDELQAVLGRLIDRLLLTQQMELSHFQQTAANEVQERAKELRKQRNDEDWRIWLHSYDLSDADVEKYIGEQLR